MRDTSSNIDANRNVRRVLVAHWVDLGRISIHTVNNAVYLRGHLVKLPGVEAPLTSAVVTAMYDKILSVVDNRRVVIDFDNWFRSPTGTWESKAELADPLARKEDRLKHGGPTYDLGEE